MIPGRNLSSQKRISAVTIIGIECGSNANITEENKHGERD